MKSLSLTVVICLFFIASCKNKRDVESVTGDINHPSESSTETDSSAQADNEYQMLAVLFTQTAAEYRALCYQSFRTAKYALEQDLAEKNPDQRRAVVLDIDETVLDNSPYQATCISQGISYPECWDDWCELAEAEAIPGVLDFLSYCRMNHVEVIFITNRKDHLREATVKNLEKLEIGSPDEDHLLMRIGENSKEPRRHKIRADYHISLLIGDNLGDFSSLFEKLTVDNRTAITDSLRTYFGERYIILPNTMYGDWVSALSGYRYDHSPEELRSLRLNALKPTSCNGAESPLTLGE